MSPGIKGLFVKPGLVIPDSELSERFIHASGPGGQNVNKVASAVQLSFDVPALPQPAGRGAGGADGGWRRAPQQGRRADDYRAPVPRTGAQPRRCPRPAGGPDPAQAATPPKPRRPTKVPKASKRGAWTPRSTAPASKGPGPSLRQIELRRQFMTAV